MEYLGHTDDLASATHYEQAAAEAADYDIACHLRFDCPEASEGDGGIGGVTNHAAIRSRTARSFAIRKLALKASPLAAALRRAQVCGAEHPTQVTTERARNSRDFNARFRFLSLSVPK